MGKPRVWELWRCVVCKNEQRRPYRTMPWTHRHGQALPCPGASAEYAQHSYVRDLTPQEIEEQRK